MVYQIECYAYTYLKIYIFFFKFELRSNPQLDPDPNFFAPTNPDPMNEISNPHSCLYTEGCLSCLVHFFIQPLRSCKALWTLLNESLKKFVEIDKINHSRQGICALFLVPICVRMLQALPAIVHYPCYDNALRNFEQTRTQ